MESLFPFRCRATQVLHIAHDLGKPGGQEDLLEARVDGQSNPEREKSQRKAFLRELEAMIRLRSPHTVGVYGAITSRPDRLVLVMELLAGGDLRRLLKNSDQPLPEEQCRRIIGDICAGMHFLHSKETVHGDLKSANVLLDGAGRAKVRVAGCGRVVFSLRKTCARLREKIAPQAKAQPYCKLSVSLVAGGVTCRELHTAVLTSERTIDLPCPGIRGETPTCLVLTPGSIHLSVRRYVADRRLRHIPVVPSHQLHGPGHVHQGRSEHPDEPRLERT